MGSISVNFNEIHVWVDLQKFCLPKMKQVTVLGSSGNSGDLSLLLEAHILCWLFHLPGERWFCQICYTCSVCFLTSLCTYKVGISLSQVRRGSQIDPILCGFQETKLLACKLFYQQSNITYFILFSVSRISRVVNKHNFKTVSVNHKPASLWIQYDFSAVEKLWTVVLDKVSQ